MKQLIKLKIEFHSNLKYIEILDEFLQQTLKKFKVPELVTVEIIIATVEAVSNAIMHGNKNDPNLKVSVEIKIFKDRIRIKVADSGSGFDLSKLKNPRKQRNLLKTNGRGVFIIKSYMDKVNYSFKKGTIVKMEKLFK